MARAEASRERSWSRWWRDEMSIAEIARAVDRSRATVRYWLAHYGFKTYAQQGRLQRAVHPCSQSCREGDGYEGLSPARRHGVLARGSRLLPLQEVSHGPSQPAQAQDQARYSLQRPGDAARSAATTVASRALHFHHVDPSSKRFHLSMQGATRSLASARAEMAKCVLLCANCHAEVESGLLTLPASDAAHCQVA